MRCRNLVAILGAVRLAAARTVDLCKAASPDPQSPEQFATFTQYSFAAYCGTLHNGGSGSPVCTVDERDTPCAGFRGVRTAAEFTGDGPNGMAGYVAVDEARCRIVVVLKGTDNLKDLISDIRIQQVDSNLCEGCKVHEGFDAGYKTVRAQIGAAVVAERRQTGFGVVVTGHSLGAAVAMLAAVDLRNQGVDLDVYMYGCPFVGNAAFAAYASAQGRGHTFRVTNARDLVTALPKFDLPLLRPYAHVFPEYWYPRGVAVPGQYARSELRVCRSARDCSSADCFALDRGLILGCNLSDHGLYAGGTAFKPCRGNADRMGKAIAGLLGGGGGT